MGRRARVQLVLLPLWAMYMWLVAQDLPTIIGGNSVAVGLTWSNGAHASSGPTTYHFSTPLWRQLAEIPVVASGVAAFVLCTLRWRAALPTAWAAVVLFVPIMLWDQHQHGTMVSGHQIFTVMILFGVAVLATWWSREGALR